MKADIESLVAEVAARPTLPPPPVRRYLRLKAGLTQGRIAKEFGVDRVTVTRWESGRRLPRGERLKAYADLLDRLAGMSR